MRKENITFAIGNTDAVRLQHSGGEIYGKLERQNPLGSVKDRAALYMIEGAERRGELKEGGLIVEATSGNTGIALSYIASSRGYRCVIVMPENMSRERMATMKALGSELVLTPASEGMKGAVARARQIVENSPGAWMPDQFSNPDNERAHYETTAREIEADFGDSLTLIVAGIGSGGTISGIGHYFKQKGYKARIVGVEPASSAVITTGKAGRHRIQGIGAGFVPSNFNASVVDEVVTVSDEEAFAEARFLARKEGLFVGISSGAALAGAKKVMTSADKVLVIMPDEGERYLSGPLWEEDGV